MDRIQVSTGFNKVGNPNRTPSEPDFRIRMAEGFLAGFLGPMITWILASLFTVALYRLWHERLLSKTLPVPSRYLVCLAKGLLTSTDGSTDK